MKYGGVRKYEVKKNEDAIGGVGVHWQNESHFFVMDRSHPEKCKASLNSRAYHNVPRVLGISHIRRLNLTISKSRTA
jgi:hypothetical protein